MPESDRAFRKSFFNNLDYDRHLEWGDPRHVDLSSDRSVMVEDPISELCDQIGFSDQPATARLLSGYRGSGKSTEYPLVRAEVVKLVEEFDGQPT